MNYKTIITKTLYELGIQKQYAGVKYLISCIDYIEHNEMTFLPVTKILYVDVAKLYNTSGINVEQGIRSIIQRIWDHPGNKELIEKIFGKSHLQNRPSNTEFLVILHDYITLSTDSIFIELLDNNAFMCPKCNEKCIYCRDLFIKFIKK